MSNGHKKGMKILLIKVACDIIALRVIPASLGTYLISWSGSREQSHMYKSEQKDCMNQWKRREETQQPQVWWHGHALTLSPSLSPSPLPPPPSFSPFLNSWPLSCISVWSIWGRGHPSGINEGLNFFVTHYTKGWKWIWMIYLHYTAGFSGKGAGFYLNGNETLMGEEAMRGVEKLFLSPTWPVVLPPFMKRLGENSQGLKGEKARWHRNFKGRTHFSRRWLVTLVYICLFYQAPQNMLPWLSHSVLLSSGILIWQYLLD